MDPTAALIGAVLFGMLVGSFLNVVILRLPARMEYDFRCQCADYEQGEKPSEEPPDLVFRGSHCPKCGHDIRWYENIPVFSYLFLRGKCSGCGTTISAQYPLIEALCGGLTGYLCFHFGWTIQAAAAVALTFALVALSGIDIRKQLLPDSITLPLLWLGLLLNTQNTFVDISSAVIGAATGYLSLWTVYWIFKLVTGKEGMGYGDFKLLAVFGAWLGWKMLPVIILLSSLVGAIIGIAMIIILGRDRNVPIPFGPYIAIAGWIAMIWGEKILSAYLGSF